ncbi:conserved hypothetical protein [Rhodospirillum centenum SW]|uniref:Macro domain-containing protein n=1 Tax=Rhodospirillum centenum (strain ATCC 51521 / SW) TaxID=414684 RepID=B6ITP9_RHOCS|nr:conserved hypothetical protein [Rhodospirillum centenum SW]
MPSSNASRRRRACRRTCSRSSSAAWTAEPVTTRLEVVEGDITTLALDAIVNAANDRLAGGGGVDGAIHRAAGWAEMQAALRPFGGCPTGGAVITPGFRLPARFVIHTVGPVWRGGGAGEPDLLAACYRRSLELAAEHTLRSIAFPAISTGVYGYPAAPAARLAVATVRGFVAANAGLLERVVFCCFSAESARLHRAALAGEAPA